MKPAKAPTKKAVRRRSGAAPDALSVAAKDLTKAVDKALIGFQRQGRAKTALVPVEAVFMLAGQARLVPAAIRREIEKGARLFVSNVSKRPAGRTARKRARSAAKKTVGPARGRAKRV